jgi:hypothetical protein
MKNTIRTIACCFGSSLLLTSSVAWAQNNTEPKNTEPPAISGGTGGQTNSPSTGGSLTASAPSASWQNAPRKYVVQRGDTLWDISRRFLGSPWYWPKLWSKNPHIYNPHWIFPGNIINFQGGQFIAKPPKKEVTLNDITRADGSGDKIDVVGRFGFSGGGSMLERRENFLDRKSLKKSGHIHASADQRTLLSEGDRVYLKFKNRNNVRSGEQYSVYRKIRKIHDPVNGSLIGYMVKLYGVVQIKEIRKKTIVGQITRAFDSIGKGYLVGPYMHNKVKLKTRRNEALVKGYVLRATSEVSLMAQFFQVFINRGSRHGVRVGNTFVVYRRGGIFRDRVSVNNRKSKVREKIGRAVVIDVRRGSCVAVVVQSAVEIQNGDEVETTLN